MVLVDTCIYKCAGHVHRERRKKGFYNNVMLSIMFLLNEYIFIKSELKYTQLGLAGIAAIYHKF